MMNLPGVQYQVTGKEVAELILRQVAKMRAEVLPKIDEEIKQAASQITALKTAGIKNASQMLAGHRIGNPGEEENPVVLLEEEKRTILARIEFYEFAAAHVQQTDAAGADVVFSVTASQLAGLLGAGSFHRQPRLLIGHAYAPRATVLGNIGDEEYGVLNGA